MKYKLGISKVTINVCLSHIPVTLGGYLAIPVLSRFKCFPPNTSLEEASKKVFEPISKYFEIVGIQPKYMPQHVCKINNSTYWSYPGEGQKLQDLVPVRGKNPHTVNVIRFLEDSDPSFLTRMVDAAAAGRAKLVENLLLAEQVEELQGGGKKKRKSKLAAMDRRFARMEEKLKIVTEENVVLKNKLNRVEEVWKNKLNHVEEENIELRNKLEHLEADNIELRSAVKTFKKSFDDIYRRIVLDQARIKILEQTGLTRNDLDSSTLLALVKSKLPHPFDLNDAALEMIFKSGPLRRRGNAAAHEGSLNAIGQAFYRSDLDDFEHENLIEIYIYGHTPMLGSSAS